MLQAYRAHKFLQNCRILEEKEEVSEGTGVAVIFNEELQRFDFCEYNYTSEMGEVTWIGNICLASLIAKTVNPNKVILLFKKYAKAIVNKRDYKLDQPSFEILESIESYTSAKKRYTC